MIAEWIRTATVRHKGWVSLLRFLATGGVNTLFGIGIYSFLVWITLPPKVALLIGMLIAMAFNFVTYGKLAFDGKLKKENVPRFVGTYIFVYFLNSELLGLLIKLGLSSYLAFVVLVPFILVTNFVLLRYYVFRDRTPTEPRVNRN